MMPLIIHMINTSMIPYIHIIRSVFKPQFIHSIKYANYAFLLLSSIVHTKIFKDNFVSHSGDRNEQFPKLDVGV